MNVVGQVREAVMSMNASISWKSLQLVITSSTAGDVEKMIWKLITFFKVFANNNIMIKWTLNKMNDAKCFEDQLRSSKMMWETAIAETSRDIGKEGKKEKEAEEENYGGN